MSRNLNCVYFLNRKGKQSCSGKSWPQRETDGSHKRMEFEEESIYKSLGRKRNPQGTVKYPGANNSENFYLHSTKGAREEAAVRIVESYGS